MVGSKVRPPLMAQVVLTTWTHKNRAKKLMNSLVSWLLKDILSQFFKIPGVSCCLLAFLSLCLNVSNSWIALFASETSKTQKTLQSCSSIRKLRGYFWAQLQDTRRWWFFLRFLFLFMPLLCFVFLLHHVCLSMGMFLSYWIAFKH